MSEKIIEFLKKEYPECNYKQVGNLVYIKKGEETIDIKDIAYLEYVSQLN